MTWMRPIAQAIVHARLSRRPALGFILFSVLLDVLALGVAIPVLPPLVQQLRHGDAAAAAGALALFGAAFAAMTFVGSPVLGALSDRVGRRPVLLIGLFALGVDYLMMAFAPTVGWLLVGRIVAGLAAATGLVANAYIADTMAPDERAQAYAWVGAVWGVGFVLGPAIGGWLGQYGLRLPFYASAALTVLGALYGLFVLPESLPPEQRSAFRWRQANPLGSLALLRSQPGLTGLSTLNFLRWLAHSAVATLFVLSAANRYGLGPSLVGAALALYGLFDILIQTFAVRPVIAWVGDRGAMLLALAFGAVALAIFAFAPNGWTFVAGLPVMALVDLFGPGFLAIATRLVSPSEQGRLQGAITGVQTAAQVAGPLLFSAIYAHFDAARPAGAPTAAFLTGAAVFALALALGISLTRPTTPNSTR